VPNNSHTIIYEKNGVKYKLCKLLYAKDGSYSVLSPYHTARKAIIVKATMNYALPEMNVSFEEAIDLAAADDDKKRLKLSHHRSGFIQFSGDGILSGLDDQGNPKGVGVWSWPLETPAHGPAFAITVFGAEHFEQATRIRDEACVFKHEELTLLPDTDRLILEGHYFPAFWRRFVRIQPDGRRIISIVHPDGAVLYLRVLFPGQDCDLQGFFGLELSGMPGDAETHVETGFILSTSTGSLRQTEGGDILGDGLFCMYPRQNIEARRSLDYTPPTQQIISKKVDEGQEE
jgi:hypothetical protein